MANIRIKDLPVGSFAPGEKMASDSVGTGSQQFDVQAVITGVLDDVHNLAPGAFVTGQKVLIDDVGGATQVDVDDVIAAVFADIQNLPPGTLTAGEKIATDSAANGARQIDVQLILDEINTAIAALGAVTTADNGLVLNPAGNVQLGGNLLANTQVGGLALGLDLDLVAADLSLIADGGTGIVLSATGADVDIATPGGEIKMIPSAGAPVVGDHWVAQNVDGRGAWETQEVPAYAEGFLAPGSPGTPFLVAAAGTPIQITGLSPGELAGPLSIVGDALLVGVGGAGMYTVHGNWSFDGSSNTNAIMGIRYNGAVAMLPKSIATRRLSTGGDVGAASNGILVALAEGDTLDMAIDSDTNGSTYNIWYANFHIHRIGP